MRSSKKRERDLAGSREQSNRLGKEKTVEQQTGQGAERKSNTATGQTGEGDWSFTWGGHEDYLAAHLTKRPPLTYVIHLVSNTHDFIIPCSSW